MEKSDFLVEYTLKSVEKVDKTLDSFVEVWKTAWIVLKTFLWKTFRDEENSRKIFRENQQKGCFDGSAPTVPSGLTEKEERTMKSNQEDLICTAESGDPTQKVNVSQAVIRRLPRYFRYLRELIREGKSRISSGELSDLMGVTASQIRQDLNCFGGFGQQGYGYNVNYLYARICELLGVGAGIRAIIIGAGDLGRALVRSPMFEKRGVDIISMFDVDPSLIGRTVGDVRIRSLAELEEICREFPIDMAVLTLPKERVEEVVERLLACGIRGIWNFTSKDLDVGDDVVVENVHLGDSLMSLNYQLCHPTEDAKKEKR